MDLDDRLQNNTGYTSNQPERSKLTSSEIFQRTDVSRFQVPQKIENRIIGIDRSGLEVIEVNPTFGQVRYIPIRRLLSVFKSTHCSSNCD